MSQLQYKHHQTQCMHQVYDNIPVPKYCQQHLHIHLQLNFYKKKKINSQLLHVFFQKYILGIFLRYFKSSIKK